MPNDLISTLAAARKAHQMTQAQLAESAGLSRMTVQRTEGGDLDPRYSTLAEMARVLGMDIIAVPSSLRPSLEAFIQAGGKFLGQPEGWMRRPRWWIACAADPDDAPPRTTLPHCPAQAP